MTKRDQAKAIAKRLGISDRDAQDRPKAVNFWHFDSRFAGAELADALREAGFRHVEEKSLYVSVAVPKDKVGKALEAEAKAEEAYLREAHEAEMAFERLAAFGPGVSGVNVVSGERWRT